MRSLIKKLFPTSYSFYLFALVIFSLVVLTFKLGTIPNGFHWDELANGYSAYSIMMTGKDEWGVHLPVFIQSFGDFKSAFLSYAVIPFFKLGGINETMVRLPGVLLAILGVFSFVKFLSFKNKSLALLGGLVLATNPWFLHYARIAFEPMPSLGVMLAGLWLWHSKDSKWKISGSILLLLSMYIYHSARLFVPILVVVHWLVFSSGKLKEDIKKNKLSWSIFIIGSIVTWYSILFTTGGERAKDVFFWNETEITSAVEEGIYRNRVLDLPFVRVFNNKGWEVLNSLVKKYFGHFSPEYLLPYNNQTEAFSFQRHGNFSLFFFPFLLVGLFLSKKKDKYFWFFLSWLLIAPIPSSLTKGMVNPNRSLILLPALCYFAARGIVIFYEFVCAKVKFVYTGTVLKLVLSVIFVASFSLYLHDWFIYFPEASEPYWHGYYKEASRDVWENRNQYNKIYFTNTDTQTYIFFSWYNLIDPQLVQSRAANRDLTTLEGVKELENVYFWPVKENTIACYLQEDNVLVVLAADDQDAISFKDFKPTKTYFHANRFHPEKEALWTFESKSLTENQQKLLTELCPKSE